MSDDMVRYRRSGGIRDNRRQQEQGTEDRVTWAQMNWVCIYSSQHLPDYWQQGWATGTDCTSNGRSSTNERKGVPSPQLESNKI